VLVETTDTTKSSLVSFATQDSGLEGSWDVGTYASSHATRAGEFFIYQGADNVGGAVNLERLTIDQTGKVGIGTTAPIGSLHLQSAAWGELYVDTTDTTEGVALVLATDDSGTKEGSWEIVVHASSAASTPGQFYIYQGKDNVGGAVAQKRITIDQNGETGILASAKITGGLSVGSTPPAVAANKIYLQASGWGEIQADTTDNTQGNAFVLATQDGGKKASWEVVANASSAASQPGQFYIYQGNDNSGASIALKRLTIDQDGEVGILASATVTGGLSVGSSPPAVAADYIRCGDADFYLRWDGTDGRLTFDTGGDDLVYDRSTDTLILRIGTGTEFTFSSTYLDCQGNNLVDVGTLAADDTTITGGLSVGASPPAVVSGFLKVEDANFSLYFDGDDGRINFDASNDYLTYDRSEDRLELKISGADKFIGDTNGLSALSTRVTSTDDSPADGTQAYQRTVWNSVVCAGWFVTASDGTVSSSGGWNVASVAQTGAGTNQYDVTCDTALNSDCTVHATLGAYSTFGFTGVPVVTATWLAAGLSIFVEDGANGGAVELQSGRVNFMATGRSGVTGPTL
jgi:hypothetical protein